MRKYQVLFGVLTCFLLSVLPVRGAANPNNEKIYLVDSMGGSDGVSQLYQVILDDVNLRANLVPLANGLIPFNQVDAMAGNPNGTRLYCFDKWTGSPSVGTGQLGYYDLVSRTFTVVGPVVDEGNSKIPGLIQAAFAPDGNLYAASENFDTFYLVNAATGQAATLGQAFDGPNEVWIQGADFAFASDGACFLWTNATVPDGGLYRIALSSTPGPISATYIGPGDGEYFTGNAFRANGYGDILGSSYISSLIHVHSRLTGQSLKDFPMYLNNQPYVYHYGDMANGSLGICALSMGYWKNHSWNRQLVEVCGVPVSQALGQLIMNNANGTNFSMLFAQLIAAKLSVNDASGIPAIDNAVAFVCGLGLNVTTDWNRPFANRSQKSQAAALASALDNFIQVHECAQ